MDKIPVTNEQKHCVYAGGVMIPAGSTRMVDPRLLGQSGVSKTPKADLPPPETPLLGVLDQSIPKIRELLPELTDAQLDEIEQGEANGKTRRGVIEAITAERLRRASPTE